MSANFTPGPWAVDGSGCIVGDQPFDFIKLISPWREQAWDGDAEALANARLIASAPELYEALVECADDLEAEVRERWGHDERLAHKLERDLAPVVKARAALAKARGQ